LKIELSLVLVTFITFYTNNIAKLQVLEDNITVADS
jgi:hypothetical protein